MRALLTWSDAGVVGPRPSHHGARPASDRGPVLRLIDQPDGRYDAVWVLTIPAGEAPTRALAKQIGPHAEVRVVDVDDPSDYAALFREVAPVVSAARRAFAPPGCALDVLLSAGTPQAQTLFVILVQSGLLPARMLQVIPAVFVGPGRPPVREVRLDMEGFPEIRALRREVARLRERVRGPTDTLVGESAPMRELKQRIARVAASDAPTLVLGETGTGKELVARALHDGSARAKGPFVAENCGVFAEGVLASELFGHEPGAFTGATTRRKGVFEQAHRGTLLLDEVGELTPRVQSALLRVLQEGALRRVGGEVKVSVDVRVIAATHKDLAAMVRAGTFREDLYYRLRGATLEVPPLRERPGDVELLVASFVAAMAARRDEAPRVVSRDAMRAMAAYAWPGNVRELRAEVERWGVFCDAEVHARDLAPEVRGAKRAGGVSVASVTTGEVTTLDAAVEAAERAAVQRALDAHGGNLSRASRALAIDRNTLKRKMRAWGLSKG